MLMNYDWPGNVRELENAVHRMVINSRENIISGVDVSEMVYQVEREDGIVEAERKAKRGEKLDFDAIIGEQERRLVEYALEAGRTTRKAAAILNITQPKLMRIKKKYDL